MLSAEPTTGLSGEHCEHTGHGAGDVGRGADGTGAAGCWSRAAGVLVAVMVAPTSRGEGYGGCCGLLGMGKASGTAAAGGGMENGK